MVDCRWETCNEWSCPLVQRRHLEQRCFFFLGLVGIPSSHTMCVVDFSIPILKSASLSIIIHEYSRIM